MRIKQFILHIKFLILNNLHFMWVLVGGTIVMVLAFTVGFLNERYKEEPVSQDLKERLFIPLNCDSISAFARKKGIKTDLSKRYKVELNIKKGDKSINVYKELFKLTKDYPDMMSVEKAGDKICLDLKIKKEQSIKYVLFPVTLFIYMEQLSTSYDEK